MQGDPGCEVSFNTSLTFRTGRSDCVPHNPARPYMAAKQEVHPNPVGDGQQTVKFFQENFGFSGKETVAIMGAHTFGGFDYTISMFRYTWVSGGNKFFNNDYYKMITDDTRWYFNDKQCTKVTDAHGNKPPRRWLAQYRRDTKNGGPVQWMSENYVCPNCVTGNQMSQVNS